MRGQIAGILGAGRADGDRGDRDTARHLNRRQQRIEAIQRPTAHRDADHRAGGQTGDCTGEVGGEPGGGDEYRAATALGIDHIVMGGGRGAVGRGDLDLVRDLQRRQYVQRGLNGRQVGVRTH